MITKKAWVSLALVLVAAYLLIGIAVFWITYTPPSGYYCIGGECVSHEEWARKYFIAHLTYIPGWPIVFLVPVDKHQHKDY